MRAPRRTLSCLAAFAGAVSAATGAEAQTTAAPNPLSEVVVTGRRADLTGVAVSANQGSISAADLTLRPLLRPGEVVEEIPGIIITQHSGSGKANQYFLRGFNLDHGTDLAVSLDGTPVNMPTHAHGQGYADLNFLIPELVERVDYEKGPYYADVGDFGSAGAFDLHYYDVMPQGLARVEGGETGYLRGVAADSFRRGPGSLLYGLELEHDDGPWVRGDDERKLSGVLRWSRGDATDGMSLTAMAYHNRWNSTDQIPDRAIAGGDNPAGAPLPPPADQISRFGEIDPTDGGSTGRYSLNADWRRATPTGHAHVSVYGLYYTLGLFSNFTYFLNDPVHGDQIEQEDRRWSFGGEASESWNHALFGRRSETTAGLRVRNDDIRNGLFHSEDRVRIGTTAEDDVAETSLSPYLENRTWWTSWLRTIVGVRAEAFWFDVKDLTNGRSRDEAASLLSPKLNVVFGPWAKTEFYFDYGQGSHSNDARGIVSPVDHATALPRSDGGEIGVRTTLIPHLRTEASLWLLDLQSELVWAGDEGDNEPSGPTRRYGVELANWWTPTPWLTVDADYAWSHTRYTDKETEGAYVPEALVTTFDGGVALHDMPGRWSPWSAGLRARYFGPRRLTQDGRVQSDATTLLYAEVGYRLTAHLALGLTVFNLLDDKVSDIDYFYISRLPGEPQAGVDDIHTHPSEPRETRVSLTARW